MRYLKVGVVIFAAVFITTLGIDAADTLQGSRATLFGQLFESRTTSICPSGMTPVSVGRSFSCVDTYEASPSHTCPIDDPTSAAQSQQNMNTVDCAAASVPGVLPWRFISREQAGTACLRAGKRLPSNAEWYIAAAGTPDDATSCNVDTNTLRDTGFESHCVSAVGAYDTVGNVWEWTADDVIDGAFSGHTVPQSGYVRQVDASGMATQTGDTPSDLFNKDYFWSSQSGAYGVLRGGFYNSQSDAGVYTAHAQTLPTAAGTAIGFRCVK